MGRRVPLRFSVLAGEVVHNLRSCLDHIVWMFSDSSYRAVNEKFIDFPILETRPTKETVFTRYDRKVKGISNANVLRIIDDLQPYHSANPANELLAILHKMDIVDKHRELVIIASTGALEFPNEMYQRLTSYQGGEPDKFIADITAEFKGKGKIVPQIAFDNFLGGEAEAVVQALMILHNYITTVMKDFSRC